MRQQEPDIVIVNDLTEPKDDEQEKFTPQYPGMSTKLFKRRWSTCAFHTHLAFSRERKFILAELSAFIKAQS